MQLIGDQKLDSIQNSIVQMRISKIEAALHAADDSTKFKVTIPNKDVPENVGADLDFGIKMFDGRVTHDNLRDNSFQISFANIRFVQFCIH